MYAMYVCDIRSRLLSYQRGLASRACYYAIINGVSHVASNRETADLIMPFR